MEQAQKVTIDHIWVFIESADREIELKQRKEQIIALLNDWYDDNQEQKNDQTNEQIDFYPDNQEDESSESIMDRGIKKSNSYNQMY